MIGGFTFNPECRCKNCRELKREFMIMAEKMRRIVPVGEVVGNDQCYFHKKDLSWCNDCVKEAIEELSKKKVKKKVRSK